MIETNWELNEPNNFYENLNCISVRKNGFWGVDNCESLKLPYLIEIGDIDLITTQQEQEETIIESNKSKKNNLSIILGISFSIFTFIIIGIIIIFILFKKGKIKC